MRTVKQSPVATANKPAASAMHSMAATAAAPDASALSMLGLRIRHWREQRGWSLRQLASESGVSLPAIQRIEVGAANAGLATVIALCNALGESLDRMVHPDPHALLGMKFTHAAMPRRPSKKLDLTGTLANAHLKSHVVSLRHQTPFAFTEAHGRGALFIYVLAGHVDIAFGDGANATLGPGDALHLSLPDAMTSRQSGRVNARMLCIIDPRQSPSEASTKRSRTPAPSRKSEDQMAEAPAIGQRIKTLRKGRALTISRLAALSKVPGSTISKIENGLLKPSLVQAIVLAEALGANLAFLAGSYRDQPQHRSIVRAADRKALHYAELGLGLQDLNGPFFPGVLEARLGLLESGAHSGVEPMTHKGDEICFVIEGAIRYRIDDGAEADTVELMPNESLQFKSDTPHSWENAHNGRTRVLWVFSDGLSF